MDITRRASGIHNNIQSKHDTCKVDFLGNTQTINIKKPTLEWKIRILVYQSVKISQTTQIRSARRLSLQFKIVKFIKLATTIQFINSHNQQ